MARGIGLCILISICVWLGCHYENSQAAERPVHSAILALICASLSLQLSSKYIKTRRKGQSYSAIPLQEIGIPHPSRQSSPIPRQIALGSRKRRLYFLLLAACIAARVETFRRIVHSASCTHRGIEVLLPVCLAVYDFITVQRHKPPPPEYDAISNSVWDDVQEAYVNSSMRYLLPTLLLCWAAYITSNSALRSTYICPILHGDRVPAPLVQYAGIFLDVVIITAAARLLSDADDNGRRSRRTQSALVMLFAAVLLAIGIFSYTVADFQGRKSWAMDLSWSYISSAFWLAIMFSVVVHLFLYLAPVIRPLSLSVVIVFACIYLPEFFGVFHTRSAFPAQPTSAKFFTFLLAFSGFVWFLTLEEISESSKTLASVSRQIPTLFMSVAGLLFVFTGFLYLVRNNGVGFHPLDLLIYNARIGSDIWIKQASSSTSLKAAVGEYKVRYGKLPPPNFDKWYDFAVKHESAIMDDYDQIHEDLLPFWAMKPSEIRADTYQILRNPWNELAGISIRNGHATVSPEAIPPTHVWMADGVALMINQFSQWLPDMDLAFNIFDEPRVAVPFQQIAAHKTHGAEVQYKKGADGSFTSLWNSDKTSSLWNSEWMSVKFDSPDQEPSQSPFQFESFKRTYNTHGIAGCPPKSPASGSWHWNPSQHCASCAAPHSVGQFLSNWTLSGDMCHQPDMANLHGFHLAPAAFKVANRLLPVFSQSKVNGYNDILYPTAWNYVDKVPYDEEKDKPFKKKESQLFWRGATSEGYSDNGEWRGMERQRLVHLANNTTDTTIIPLLINDNKLSYQNVPFRDLKGLLHFNISFVDHAVRCGALDCETQNAEFNITEGNGVDFQENWKYKYLIDVDGSAFSGRFLPFLQSHSLPFKAGIFREWYDARLMPWLHFVPIDSRFHGLHATLAYFAGLGDGSGKRGFERVGGKLVQMEGRQDQAEWIAEQGRKWSRKVLRKEDMEIYFFRLLLEWGRLVDDRREEIGFWLDE